MRKPLSLLTAAIAALALTTAAHAETLKVGMITTLSGGGAALGIDVRDAFMLAIKQAGADIEVIVDDDQRKPDIAVQLADKMIQSDKVDVLTGIIWSNLAIAVVPAVVQQGKFYLSPNAGPSLLAGERCHENYFNVAWQNDNLAEAAGGYANDAGYANSFLLAPNYPAGRDMLTGYKRFYKGAVADEVYTKLGANEYAPEIAQIRASGADSVYFFLPGGMGIAFPQAVCAGWNRHPARRAGLLLRSGHPAGRRRGGNGCEEHVAVEQGHRQSDQQGLRRELPGRVRPPALALRESGLRHREPADLGHGQGERLGCRRISRCAEGGRL